MISNLHKFLGAILLATFIKASSQSICFLAPYITSFRANTSNNSVTFTFVLDYKHKFLVKDIILLDTTGNIDSIFDRSHARTEKDSNYNPTDIIYTDDRVKIHGGYQTLLQSKTLYYNQLKKILHKKPIGLECSEFYIYDAVYIRPLNETHLLEVMYHEFTRCYRFLAETAENKTTTTPLTLIPYNADDDYWKAGGFRRVTSVSLMLPYLFELSPDGALFVRRFKDSEYPSATRPLGGVHVGVYYELYPGIPKSHSFIQDQKCQAIARNVWAELNNETISDYIFYKPFRTVFKKANSLYGFSSYFHKDLRMPEMATVLGPANSNGKPVYVPAPSVIPFGQAQDPNFSVEAISIAEKDGQILDSKAIFRKISTGQHFYVHNGHFHIISLPNTIVPDDIVHWTSCKKVISFYGFAYTMHEYDELIIYNRSSWMILNESQFKYPIEAVHADGDRFFFFIKSTTVRVMSADSSDCSRKTITFNLLEDLHNWQLFNPNIPQLLLEERFFDGTKWQPDKLWPNVTTGVTTPTDSSKTILWPYLVALLVITSVFLILILVYVLKSTEKARGDTIYSIDRSSSAIKSDRRQQSRTSFYKSPASSMPLFSHHHSIKSVVKSATKSIGAPRRPYGSPKRVKRASSPAKSPKKSAKIFLKTRSPKKSPPKLLPSAT